MRNRLTHRFQVYNSELSLSISELSKIASKSKGYESSSFKRKKLILTKEDTNESHSAVNYFNSRFQTNFSNEEIVENFKAVTDSGSFFKANSIYPPQHQYDFSKSIGFTSFDGSHIIFRDISGNQPKRYFNLSLLPESEYETNKFYTIKNTIDILQPEIDLILTEGVFDIIGVYSHFYTDKENKIFAAACGKGYNSVISHFIHMGFLNLNITIYSDKDVPIEFYRNLKNSSPYLRKSSINIFYNKIGKDFGVPKDQIVLSKTII